MLRCIVLALVFTTLGAVAHAQDDPALFMASVRARAAAQPAPPACPPPQPDAAGVVRSSTLPGKAAGEAAGATGGLSHPLLLVTSTEDTPARSPARGTLRWAVAEARQAGGGWIAFAPGLAGQVIRVASTLRIPSNTTVDGGCGVTLLAPARVTTLLVQDAANVILSGLTFAKEAYDDVEDKTGDAVGLAGHFDQVAILHNAFSRCGDGCVDIVRKQPSDRLSRVTVAFNRFSRHNKVMLVGTLTCYGERAEAERTADCATPLSHLDGSMKPTLRVTLLANLFDGTSQRHPKVVSNGFVQSVNNVVVLASTAYGDGRDSAVYGTAAASGGLLVSRGDLFVNPTGRPRTGAGPVSALSDAMRRETDGAVAAEGAMSVGPVRVVQHQAALALAHESGPAALEGRDPAHLATCVLRVAGPAGVGLAWPQSCGAGAR